MTRVLCERLPHHDDDRGFTLTELIVAMALLTVFMTIFTTVTLMMTNTTSKVQRLSSAVQQSGQALITLDKSLRYATAISTPGIASGYWHVEFNTSEIRSSTVNGVTTTTPVDICTQLRVANRQLQQRTWTVSGSSYASGSLTAWKPIASNVINDANAVPVTDPVSGAPDYRPFWPGAATKGASSSFQRLTVTIVAASSDSSTDLANPDANRASMTFAAVNSVAGNTAPTCQQVAVGATS